MVAVAVGKWLKTAFKSASPKAAETHQASSCKIVLSSNFRASDGPRRHVNLAYSAIDGIFFLLVDGIVRTHGFVPKISGRRDRIALYLDWYLDRTNRHCGPVAVFNYLKHRSKEVVGNVSHEAVTFQIWLNVLSHTSPIE